MTVVANTSSVMPQTQEELLNLGATVVRPETNSGSKAGAQNAALVHVDTEFTLAVDADTVPTRYTRKMASPT